MSKQKQNLIYLAVGTNLGDRPTNLREALAKLPPQVEVQAVSRLYETAAAYVLDQPAFLNIALKGTTTLSPVDLLAYLKKLEKKLGRKKSRRYGPRLIDLDIIFYNDLILDIPDLQIPHARLTEREFVLRPLADVGAEMVYPGRNQTVAELLDQLPATEDILNVIDWQ